MYAQRIVEIEIRQRKLEARVERVEQQLEEAERRRRWWQRRESGR